MKPLLRHLAILSGALIGAALLLDSGDIASRTADRATVALPESLPPADYTPEPESKLKVPDDSAKSLRRDALSRARVWRAPHPPPGKVDFLKNPPDEKIGSRLACKFLLEEPSGTTSKFDCILPGGEVVKVKYGSNPEIPAELAATRLLKALGFGADDMFLVETLRCFGCPAYPFNTLRLVAMTKAWRLYEKRLDYSKYHDFEWVAVERRFRGKTISAMGTKGWAWWELKELQAARRGATARELDAFRLMAVFLNHWDNKSENQRLVCLPRGDPPGPAGRCRLPFALVNDAGATFGPKKVNLRAWQTTPIWKQASTCLVSMETLPHQGATFPESQISEAGRKLLASGLTALSDKQIRDLFVGARFPEHHAAFAAGRDVGKWVAAFKEKVRQIAARPPCPR